MRLKSSEDYKKPVVKVTPFMCCCFCRESTLSFCSQSGTEVTNTSLPVVCHLISVRVTAPWFKGKLYSLLFIHAPRAAAVLVQPPPAMVHYKVPDSAFRFLHLCLWRRLAELCSRITPDECLGQPLIYIFHLLKNCSVSKGGLSAHFVCCRFEATGKCLSVSMNLLLKSSELTFHFSTFYLLSVSFL